MTEIDTGHDAPSSDEFEQLARKAMAELKRPAPEHGMARVRSRGQRRQATGTVLKIAGTVGVLVLGGVLVARAGRDNGDKAPAAPVTTVSQATTAVPATTAAAAIRPPILTGEAWIALNRTTPDRQQAGNQRGEIVLVRPDGTGAHPLIDDLPSSFIEQADWSPDGSRLLFGAHFADDRGEVWTANADGSGAQLLVPCASPCAWVGEASWSPDGAQVAYERVVMNGTDGVFTLEVVDVATGVSRVLLTAPPLQGYLAPRWSPDGTQLVFESATFPDQRLDKPSADVLAVIDVANPSAGIRPLTGGTGMAFPDWSPDGSLIVYTADVPGTEGRDVYSIRPDGTGATRLSTFADQGAEVQRPRFTPDGQYVMFSWHEANLPINQVALLGLDGKYLPFSGAQALLGWDPQWRPGTPVG